MDPCSYPYSASCRRSASEAPAGRPTVLSYVTALSNIKLPAAVFFQEGWLTVPLTTCFQLLLCPGHSHLGTLLLVCLALLRTEWNSLEHSSLVRSCQIRKQSKGWLIKMMTHFFLCKVNEIYHNLKDPFCENNMIINDIKKHFPLLKVKILS